MSIAGEVVGTIETLWRFPVKSMPGEEVEGVTVTQGGVVGDRAYGLVDRQTGKVASAKHPKVWPDLLRCHATFIGTPDAGAEMPPARISLPDGTTLVSDDPDADATLSRFFGRDVELSPAAPDDFRIDQYHPDQPDLDPAGHRDEVTETRLGAALFNERGLPSAVPPGSFFDVFPLSLITTSTVERLEQLEPRSSFDVRRFRMNLVVDTPATGFVENGWVGRTLAIGDDVRITVTIPDPRCVMTTLAQRDLPRDPGILKALGRHNRLDVGGDGLYPCAGVYAVTEAAGVVRTGDPVRLV